MRRYIPILLLLTLTLPTLTAQEEKSKGVRLLERVEQQYSNHKGVTATYLFESGEIALEGKIEMEGNAFRLITDEMQVWYNGVEQWTLFASSGEVNLSQPEAEELGAINPFALFSLYKQGYSVEEITAQEVKLTAQEGQPLSEIRLAVDAQQLHPTQIVLTQSDGSTFTIKVLSYKDGVEFPPHHFSFAPKDYPDYEVIDLR